MELGYYLAVCLIALVFATKRTLIRTQWLFKLFWLLVFLGLSLIVRQNYDVDINAYAVAMSSQSLSIYYLKEPVVWLGQRFLYGLFDSSFLVFVTFDFFAALFTYAALNRLKTPQYVYFSMLLFFPFVLGMQNIYRQWFSVIIFLYAFSVVLRSGPKSKIYFSFFLSVLSHHVSAVFLSLLFFIRKKVLGKLLFWSSLIVSILGIYFGAETKSSASTGADLSIVYLIALVSLLFLLLALDRGIVKRPADPSYKVVLISIAIVLFAILFLSSTGSERLSMFALIIIYPFVALKIENRLKQKVFSRVCYSMFGFVPIFMFGTSKFLVN